MRTYYFEYLAYQAIQHRAMVILALGGACAVIGWFAGRRIFKGWQRGFMALYILWGGLVMAALVALGLL